VLVAPAHSASLATRSNWALAATMPTSRDFPAGWGYQLFGWLPRAHPADTVTPTPPPAGPGAVYAPAACANVPKILSRSGAALAGEVGVNRYTELFAWGAESLEAPATGDSERRGPNARLWIWLAPDGPARIANYLDWLDNCDSYHVTNYGVRGEVRNERTVATAVEARSPDGSYAAVTRTFTLVGGHEPPLTDHVSYYAVRGVILECWIYMDGSDRDLVRQRAAQTLQRLRAL
jgi:hypothetical protein